MLAMVLYPDVQEKARREIDSVIGLGRLPDFNDRGSLPYIDAIVKEVLRYVAFTDNPYISQSNVTRVDGILWRLSVSIHSIRWRSFDHVSLT